MLRQGEICSPLKPTPPRGLRCDSWTLVYYHLAGETEKEEKEVGLVLHLDLYIEYLYLKISSKLTNETPVAKLIGLKMIVRRKPNILAN